MTGLYIIGFAAALIMAFIMTPAVKKLAFWVGAIDMPNERKVHTKPMPRLGGVAIYLSFIGAMFVVLPVIKTINTNAVWGLLIGGSIIVVIGALDDRFDLSPKVKLLGQILAAFIVVYVFGLRVNIELLNIPVSDSFLKDLSWLSIPITMLWIVGVTNAINLIDGLDGLAAGVSGISTATMLVMAILMGNVTVILLSVLLLGSIFGFLFFNFHPAKIFMGDSGALFLGFSIATLSILGYKQVTLVSFIVPLLIIGVPLSDTVFAILRRLVNKKPIFTADKGHLHHCLREIGFGHRKTVLIIYAISAVFGAVAILLANAVTLMWVTMIIIAALLLFLVVGAEAIGIIDKTRKPVLRLLRKALPKTIQPSSRSRGR